MSAPINYSLLIGTQIGPFKLLGIVGKIKGGTLLKCECIKCNRIVERLAGYIKRVNSCGCQMISSRTKHGFKKDPIFGIWKAMVRRCTNPKDKRYDKYGGRGIKVCERWKNSFIDFKSDMGPRPIGKERYTLERKNNNSDYEPENVIWATYYDQNRNYSRNKYITWEGETKTLLDWEKHLNLANGALAYRLKNMDINTAFTLKVNRKNRSKRFITIPD